MQTITLKQLLEAGCHFGHKAERWHPKAKVFIYEERDGIHVIDLVQTKAGLEKAAEFVRSLGASGKKVLFMGTKRQAATIVREEASSAQAPYITQHWIGGFLTNWNEVHKNLQKIRRLTEEQANNGWKKFPKHERVKLGRYLNKLNQLYGGVVQLMTPPDALFVVDIRTEAVAVAEARKMGIPIIGIVDTNADPELVDYMIPSNDDAVGAVKLIVSHIARAYQEGLEAYKKESAKAAEKAEADKIAAQKALEEAKKIKEAKPTLKDEIKKEEEKAAAKLKEKKAVEKKVENKKS